MKIVRECFFPAPHQDRCQEQLQFVDKPESKSLCCQLVPPDQDILLGSLFQFSNFIWIEVARYSCFVSGYSFQCFGIHDFISCLPYLRKITRLWRTSR